MKGNNSLVLNAVTMIEAVQFWLDDRMKAPVPTVTEVKAEGSGSYTFKIELSGEADRPSGPAPPRN